jgi:hypothetical protein
MRDSEKPRRVDGLEVHESRDGLVIYVVEADEVHYLNPPAALIYELCDGTNTLPQMAELVRSAFNLPAPPLDDVRRTVSEFLEKGLLIRP